MIRKNTHSSDCLTGNIPFFLKPEGKDYLWGGSRLNDDFSKGIAMEPLAETWECSTHPDGPSSVAGGPFDKCLLRDVLQMHPEFLGTHPSGNGDLPILIKFIDANKDLSVQVHPDDAYAAEHENGQNGKVEMWYVLDAAKDASLVYGLRHSMTPDAVKDSIENGTLESHLQKIHVRKDDVFYVESGTIHAIGAGTLVAEIQENSNLTYRLYDYDRVGRDGRKRELHIEKALEVASLEACREPRQPMRVLQYRRGCATELLGRCRYFEVHRMLVNTERCREMVPYRSDSSSFRVLLCVDGCGCFSYSEDREESYLSHRESAGYEVREEVLRFYKGDCLFVPANSVEIRIHGRAQFLDVRA